MHIPHAALMVTVSFIVFVFNFTDSDELYVVYSWHFLHKMRRFSVLLVFGLVIYRPTFGIASTWLAGAASASTM